MVDPCAALRARAAATLLALTLGAACGGTDSSAARALGELERLAFVPAGQVHVGAFVPLVLYANPEPLVVDLFEATRGELARFAEAQPGALAAEMLERVSAWPEGTEDWPASFLTRAEARRYAAWRGMRLLTSSEWLFCALGPERRLFPWVAYERQDSIANTLELGLERPCPVGTFEGGRSPRGLYDLLGNVAEWVADDVLARGDGGPSPPAAVEGRVASALGGSFRTWLRPVYRPLRASDAPEQAYLAYSLHPGSRQDDVGLRCAAPAAEYLRRAAPLWNGDSALRARLVAVGRRWGRVAVPLLTELAAEPAAAPGLLALLEGARE